MPRPSPRAPVLLTNLVLCSCFLQPQAQKQAVFDALALHTCNITGIAAPAPAPAPAAGSNPGAQPAAGPGGARVYVDSTKGDDTAAGTLAAPVKTLAHAQKLARAGAPAAAVIFLRAGTHVLGATLELTAADSGLTIQPYNGEEVEVGEGGRGAREGR